MSKTDDKIVCDYCNREFRSEGYLRQHLLHCNEKSNEKIGNKEMKCPDCGGDIRKIDLDDPDEYYLYYQLGASHICDECEEVFKK